MLENNRRNDSKSLLISKDAPFQYVEAYKSFRTNLQFASVSREYKKIIVTSSVPGEGKSTVAVNLAIALAGSGSRVLLVDTDLRKPVLHKYLKVGKSKIGGLTSILAGLAKPNECILYFQDIGIYLLNSGPIPPNPVELLGSKRMEELIANLSGQYDYIILDTPPVSVVTDAAVLSKLADGVILVVRQGFTAVDTAKMAKKNLENVNANIIGSVLNDFRPDKSNKSYSYYHYKKYNYVYK